MNDGIKLIKADDREALDRLAGNLATTKMVEWFWEDSLKANILVSFLALFANPNHVVFDIGDGDGVVVFAGISPGWRATLHAAFWGPRAAGKRALHRQAIAVAMEMHDLLVVEAITREDNEPAIRALREVGFTYQGSIPNRLCYNGETKTGEWWVIDRAAAGLKGR